MKRDDLTGQKFNKLTAIERLEGVQPSTWKCVCECGNITYVRASNLKTGAVKSCGCLNVGHPTHQQSKTRLYRTWHHMKCRCNTESSTFYDYYGGRGISVCDDWNDNFESFRDWAYANGYDDNATIERIDVNGNYEPDNCKWIPNSEQANNRRSNVLITYNGRTQNLMHWCEDFGLDYKRVHNRMFKLGWSFEDAISRPVNVEKRNMEARRLKNG